MPLDTRHSTLDSCLKARRSSRATRFKARRSSRATRFKARRSPLAAYFKARRSPLTARSSHARHANSPLAEAAKQVAVSRRPDPILFTNDRNRPLAGIFIALRLSRKLEQLPSHALTPGVDTDQELLSSPVTASVRGGCWNTNVPRAYFPEPLQYPEPSSLESPLMHNSCCATEVKKSKGLVHQRLR